MTQQGQSTPIVARLPIGEAAESAGQDLLRFVLTLVEFLRRLMEAQALRRFEAGSLTAAEEERLGTGLAACESVVQELCARHGIDPSALNLDLGPLGRLM